MKVILEFTESQLALLCRISSEKGKTLEQLIALSVCKFIESEQTPSADTVKAPSHEVSQVLESSLSSMFQISANPHSFFTPVVPQDSSEDVVEEEVSEEITEFDSEEDMKSVEEFLF